ncbi:MAG: cupin domain-containing protein [Oleiphilaceae bacterium]|nr:cupin domain-containing protein [Oleiphilaceae bacterium]
MAILEIPEQQRRIENPEEIKAFLNEAGVFFDQWQASKALSQTASQDEVLEAYADTLMPYMKENGYEVADVINIHPAIENYPAIRAKFLSEHTHSEDEVRFFVEGQGLFWFNIEGRPVFNVLCQRGDLISVPKNTKHWFDAGETEPNVKAIRIFIDPAGWVPHYTESGIEQKYL